MINFSSGNISDLMNLGSSGKASKEKKDDIKIVLEALTTTIESINERLERGGGGAGGDNSAAVTTYLQRINSSLQYIYQFLSNVKHDQEDLKKGMGELKLSINKSVAEAAQTFMNDTRKILQVIQTQEREEGPETKLSDKKKKSDEKDDKKDKKEMEVLPYILDFEKRVQQLIIILTEETEILKKQNKYLQNRLDSIESKIDRLVENKVDEIISKTKENKKK